MLFFKKLNFGLEITDQKLFHLIYNSTVLLL
jgi:hypothetical protein